MIRSLFSYNLLVNRYLIISEKCSRECLSEGLLFNGILAVALCFYFSNTSFVQSFETELLGLVLLGITVGLSLKLWFRPLNVIDIKSRTLLKAYGNRFFYKKDVLLNLSNIQLLRLQVDSYFSSLSTRHIKINLFALDIFDSNIFVGQGSDKFWKLLYSSILISKNFKIPLESDSELNEYLKRIELPLINQNHCEDVYKSKARMELITDFAIWCGIAIVPFIIAIMIFIAVGPRIT